MISQGYPPAVSCKEMSSAQNVPPSSRQGDPGPGKYYLVDSVVRAVAEANEFDQAAYPARYGTMVENEIFSMHKFCWCEEEICPWCGPANAPNFHYKPLDFKLWWYKYIGRGTEINKKISDSECAEMLSNCLAASPQRDKALDK